MSDTDRFREAARRAFTFDVCEEVCPHCNEQLMERVEAAIRTEAEALAAERVEAERREFRTWLADCANVWRDVNAVRCAAYGEAIAWLASRSAPAAVRLSQADRELISMYGSASAREAGPGAEALKLGDRVRVDLPGHSLHGEVGTVSEEYRQFWVHIDSQQVSVLYHESELERLPSPSPQGAAGEQPRP